MTDEEKKSIEIIKFLQDKCIQENGTGVMYIYRIDDLANAIKILLNLIEKQSKEIEELFAENQSLKYTNGNMIHKDVVRVNYTSNDKIKAKIERKFLEAKGLYERGVQPQAQYTMKLLRDLEESLLEKE